jgi:hypothetical protein
MDMELCCKFVCSHIDLLPEAPYPFGPAQHLHVRIFAMPQDSREAGVQEPTITMVITARMDLRATVKCILDRLDLPPGAVPKLFLRSMDILWLQLQGIESWRVLTQEEIGQQPLVLEFFYSID